MSGRIGIIVGSTRPGRKSTEIAQWIMSVCPELNLNLIDLAEQNLPFLDEPQPAAYASYETYTKEHTKKWSSLISAHSAFIFVTPEYNGSIPGVLKNAIDYLCKEWAQKPAAIVSYGGGGGECASEHLRQILQRLKVVLLEKSVSLTLSADFVNYSTLKPRDAKKVELAEMLATLVLASKVTSSSTIKALA